MSTHLYPLSLHDALPISLTDLHKNGQQRSAARAAPTGANNKEWVKWRCMDSASSGSSALRISVSTSGNKPATTPMPMAARRWRSEEHTSELQSRGHLVCRLLLEKRKRR